ncbi:MAG: ATP-binding protein [Elusimicrobia bacterium]|nr:ATP-binding protein [Elusimicrobiota bacterium]
MRLQQKVLVVGLPVAIVIGALVATVSRRATVSIMTREAARRVLPQAEDAALRIAAAAATGREDILLPRVQAVQAFSGAAYAAVVSPEGRVLAHTNVLEKGRRRDDPPARRALAASVPVVEEVVEEGRRRLFFGLPVWRPEDEFLLSGKDRTRVGTLLLSLPLDVTLESARRAGTQVVWLVLFFCAVVLGGALALLRLLLRRLRAISDATVKVAGGDYSASVPSGSADELGELAGAFNNMSAALSRTVVSRDRLEEALSIARATLEASADGILVVGTDMKIVTFNRRFLEMWGLPEEVVRASDNRRIVELVTPLLADPAAFLRRSTLSYENFEIDEQRDVLRLKDGRVYERISRPYRLEGAAIGRTLTFRDLTPFMEAERVKGQFMANVSHELRTPLNAVVGAAGLLRGTRLDPGQQESVEILSRAAQSLLDFAKSEAERMTMERAVLRPADVLSDAVSLVAAGAVEKNLRLAVDAKEAAGLSVVGDPARLRQVLLNMLSNAVKFTESGEIAAELRARALGEKSVELEFSVRDTGIGITPEQGKRLFAPFSQADGSTTRRYGGTGLGLAISKSLAELMGGEFGFDSEPGRGSRFWLKIKCERVSGAESGPRPPQPPSGAARDRLRVLVVEDNTINRRLLVRQLERLGCRAEAAASGAEALELLRAGDYGLILMDCQMPELDGYATTVEVRRREAGRRRVPIVALTANSTEGDRRRCLESGMDDFMSKPATLEALYAALERWDLPFDEKSFESFLEIAGAGDDRARLFSDFLADADANLAAVRAALAKGDLAAAGRAAHSLKGACASIGARGLRELMRRTEEAAERGGGALEPLLAQAADELGRVKGRLRP